MDRLDEVSEFLEFEYIDKKTIEPESRHDDIRSQLFEVIDTSSPEVIVKAGLGNGKLLLEIVEKYDAYIVVVEPSFKVVQDFLKNNSEKKKINELRFIIGGFQQFPVDYYKADLLICIDYLDFLHSSKCLDEFKRALNFEKIFFYAGALLDDNDIEGVYDELKKILFPLHNDYYLEGDLKTYIELKDYTLKKHITKRFERDLESDIEYFGRHFKKLPVDEIRQYIRDHSQDFEKYYQLTKESIIMEPYFIGNFMRNKPEY